MNRKLRPTREGWNLEPAERTGRAAAGLKIMGDAEI